MTTLKRRDFLRLAAVGGGAVFAQSLMPRSAHAAAHTAGDFYFIQLSDTHWGYDGPDNPEARVTLRKTVATINALPAPPAFIVFTGDLIEGTEDPLERTRRMTEFRLITRDLTVQQRYFLPGEHDAALDQGQAFVSHFGPMHYSFEHGGVRFIALDNVSSPDGGIGESQLSWLRHTLAQAHPEQAVVVFAHRPLFDLAPQWDWTTRDGAAAIAILQSHPNVTVFYGHIHQEHHHMTGPVAHHSARSLIYPFPAPGTQAQQTPLPWDPDTPFRGLGFSRIAAAPKGNLRLTDFPVERT